MSKKTDGLTEEEEQERQARKGTYIELKDPYETYRRPYGLLAKAGIATAGMRPRDAWNAVNELRRAEVAAKRQEKEAGKPPKRAKIKPARAVNKPKAKEPQSGWYNRNGKPSPTLVAGGLADIAPYDPQRFAELYEKYDKHLHFRKNTNAAKLYEQIKTGKYTGLKGPKKLYESDSYKVYQKNIKAGERVFLNFPVQPKPQMIWALKKRGWHWNDLENAWGVPVDKYDEKFVKGIEENYSKYL